MSGVESEDGNVVELALQYLQRQNKTFCKFISLLCENRRGHVLGCLCLFVCLFVCQEDSVQIGAGSGITPNGSKITPVDFGTNWAKSTSQGHQLRQFNAE